MYVLMIGRAAGQRKLRRSLIRALLRGPLVWMALVKSCGDERYFRDHPRYAVYAGSTSIVPVQLRRFRARARNSYVRSIPLMRVRLAAHFRSTCGSDCVQPRPPRRGPSAASVTGRGRAPTARPRIP